MSRIDDRLIDAMPSPGDMHADQRAAAVASVSGRLQQIIARYADLVATSHAAATGSAGVKVAVSRTPPVPVNLDLVDLTASANPLSACVANWAPHTEDQTGHIAVASQLLTIAIKVAPHRHERVPRWDVPGLCEWLDFRLEWVYDHPDVIAWDEMAAKLDRVARALYGTLTPKRARLTLLSAPCPQDGCEGALARREDECVECGDPGCGRILKASEYRDWELYVIHREANGGWGITAAAIAIRAQVPTSTVRRWATDFKWQRTGPEQRPVLYCAEQAEATIAKLELRRKAKEARAA